MWCEVLAVIVVLSQLLLVKPSRKHPLCVPFTLCACLCLCLSVCDVVQKVLLCGVQKLSTSKSKNRRSDAIALEPELQQVLLSAGTADTIAR